MTDVAVQKPSIDTVDVNVDDCVVVKELMGTMAQTEQINRSEQ